VPIFRVKECIKMQDFIFKKYTDLLDGFKVAIYKEGERKARGKGR